jgi:hypothetical protein
MHLPFKCRRMTLCVLDEGGFFNSAELRWAAELAPRPITPFSNSRSTLDGPLSSKLSRTEIEGIKVDFKF